MPTEIDKFQALAVFSAIKFLRATGQPINSAYTEENLAAAAAQFTRMGPYHPGHLADAEADLRIWFADTVGMTVDDEPIEYPEG